MATRLVPQDAESRGPVQAPAAAGSRPATSRADLQPGLNALLLATLVPILASLSVWFGFWAAVEWWLPPETGRGQRVAVSIALSVLFLVAVPVVRRPLPPALPVHAIILAVMLLLAAKNLHAIWVTGDIDRSTVLFIVVLVAGFLMLSTRWLAAGIVVVAAAWLMTVFAVNDGGVPQGLIAGACVAAIGSLIVHFGRLRIYRRLERLRLDNESQRARLADAIDKARHEIDERRRAEDALREAHVRLEETVATRTAELRRSNAELKNEIRQRVRLEGLREHALTQLSAKNDELERFAYTVSHDLKAPLVTIRGFAGMLREDWDAHDDKAFDDSLTRIQNAAGTMTALLDDVLRLSRSGRVVGEPETVRLADVVGEALRLVETALAGAGGQAVVDDGLPSVLADRGRLLEVMVNLFDNAIKFSRPGVAPRIHVGTSLVDGALAVFVRDNGRGLDPSQQAKAFAVFEKLDADAPGSGVGLALVQRIVEVHGGRIWVESAAPLPGTTMQIVLPWLDASGAVPSPVDRIQDPGGHARLSGTDG